MRDKFNIVEVDRRPTHVRRESDFLRDGRNQLDRQLHTMLDMKKRAWEQGFAAAMEVIARGTRDFDHEEITAEYPIVDPTVIDIEVD